MTHKADSRVALDSFLSTDAQAVAQKAEAAQRTDLAAAALASVLKRIPLAAGDADRVALWQVVSRDVAVLRQHVPVLQSILQRDIAAHRTRLRSFALLSALVAIGLPLSWRFVRSPLLNRTPAPRPLLALAAETLLHPLALLGTLLVYACVEMNRSRRRLVDCCAQANALAGLESAVGAAANVRDEGDVARVQARLAAVPRFAPLLSGFGSVDPAL